MCLDEFLKKGDSSRQPDSIKKKNGIRRICTYHFREWQIYVETLLYCGLHIVKFTPLYT
jgi:hypothetical protein